ncbi:MAG: lysoplasmalogenase family protein [Solirubrobacterales bacterium]
MSALRNIAAGLKPVGTALRRAAAQPERAVFVGSAIALAVAGAKRSRRTEVLAKPLLMASLQIGLARTACRRSDIDNALLFGATGASLVGDWYMLEEEFAPTQQKSDRFLKRGAACFAVNHALMIALAVKHGARPTKRDALLRLGSLAEAKLVLYATNRELFLPIAWYSAALTAMSTVMASPSLVPADAPAGDPRRGLELGGLSFVASDGTILHRRTFFKDTAAGSGAEAFVLASYALAQMLLVDGLEKLAERPEPAAR